MSATARNVPQQPGRIESAFRAAVGHSLDPVETDSCVQRPFHQQKILTHPHFATLDVSRGKHRKYLPWAFTEHGAIMAATILSSPRAVEMTVYVVRAFVRLRRVLASHVELARELDELKRSVADLDADTKRQFDQVYEAILGLMGTSVRRQ